MSAADTLDKWALENQLWTAHYMSLGEPETASRYAAKTDAYRAAALLVRQGSAQC